jgi:hypothetical protein
MIGLATNLQSCALLLPYRTVILPCHYPTLLLPYLAVTIPYRYLAVSLSVYHMSNWEVRLTMSLSAHIHT